MLLWWQSGMYVQSVKGIWVFAFKYWSHLAALYCKQLEERGGLCVCTEWAGGEIPIGSIYILHSLKKMDFLSVCLKMMFGCGCTVRPLLLHNYASYPQSHDYVFYPTMLHFKGQTGVYLAQPLLAKSVYPLTYYHFFKVYSNPTLSKPDD